MKFGCCIESYIVTVFAVNDTGKIHNALRKFGTLEFVHCMGENVVNGVRSNEVRLYILFIYIHVFLQLCIQEFPDIEGYQADSQLIFDKTLIIYHT